MQGNKKALNPFNDVLLIKTINHKGFIFNPDIMGEELVNYLDSQSCEDEYTSFNPLIHAGRPQTYYGLIIYDKIEEYLELLKCRDIKLAHRVFHVLYDHKVLMQMRIEYLIKKGYFANASEILEGCIQVKKQTHVLQNMMIKYRIRKKKIILDQMIGHLRKIRKAEQKYLFRVMKNIQFS